MCRDGRQSRAIVRCAGTDGTHGRPCDALGREAGAGDSAMRRDGRPQRATVRCARPFRIALAAENVHTFKKNRMLSIKTIVSCCFGFSSFQCCLVYLSKGLLYFRNGCLKSRTAKNEIDTQLIASDSFNNENKTY